MQAFDINNSQGNRSSDIISPSTRTNNTEIEPPRRRFAGLNKVSSFQRYLPLSLLVIALILRAAVPSAANFSYVLIIIYAMLGRANMLHAIAAIWFFTMSNADITGMASSAVIWRFAIIQLAAAYIAIYYLANGKKLRVTPIIIIVTLFALFVCFHSLLISDYPLVSILKVVNWSIMCLAIIAIWDSFSIEEFKRTENEIFIGLCLMAIISLVFLKSDTGYTVNGTGFQGVLNHPQNFGVMLAITSAWLIARVLTQKKFPWISLVVVFICIFLTLRTECRTAGLALVFATCCAVAIKLAFPKSLTYATQITVITRRTCLLLVACVIPLLIAGTVFSKSISQFIQKRNSDSNNIVDIYMQSRGELIDSMIFNIKQHPYTGIGFGIASDPGSMNIFYDKYFNLPISASVEKGVLPVAVLEETGVIGFSLFLIIILFFTAAATRNGLTQLLVLLTVIFTNLAEYTFFSPGGAGMLLILVLAWSVSSPTMTINRRFATKPARP